MGYSEARGKLVDEKNQKQKISWHCPFKREYIWVFFRKFMVDSVCFGLLRNSSVCFWFHDTNRNKCKTDVVNFFLFVSRTPYARRFALQYPAAKSQQASITFFLLWLSPDDWCSYQSGPLQTWTRCTQQQHVAAGPPGTFSALWSTSRLSPEVCCQGTSLSVLLHCCRSTSSWSEIGQRGQSSHSGPSSTNSFYCAGAAAVATPAAATSCCDWLRRLNENTGKDLLKSSKFAHCLRESVNEFNTQNLYLKILMLLSLSQAFSEDLMEGDACCPLQVRSPLPPRCSNPTAPWWPPQ